ncbi:DDT domain-containing protein DDR4 isoform X2 [Juglans microcarpa x Juglans regia]|uniref:DDT domain-containing protein DDR4 isoform X2 n=1 Tax=Juglans microcarpa x Juglans regia TaxID=2249226 RepID=UPI001B7EBD4D|nr:DDT domain-containing protein DDR4 isoform X2 [Juglans microcarpa x Juglans regia]
MISGRRTRASTKSEAVGKDVLPVAKDGSADQPVVVLDDSRFESEVAKLRGRWELASVFNFLSVFEPVIGTDLKLSAEEIETGLIKTNRSNAQLHIALLKGIPPVSKVLNGSDAWVTALCKKLAMWWPWVSEGKVPLMAAKGEEISRYKGLDPTDRLLILKALCEVRADQQDVLSYINDALKQGNQMSCFRKDKIGGDGSGTSYWYDGNKTIGHRLYREVNIYQSKRNSNGKRCLTPPTISFQWETIATSLEEFRKVVDELSCSKVVAEVDVGKTIETDAIPVLEKLQKNKERALKRKQRQDMLLNSFSNPHVTGITRSCRTRNPISYTFDEYDRAIDEAIQLTKKGKASLEQSPEREGAEHGTRNGNGGQEMYTGSKENSGERGDSMDSDIESDVLQEVGIDDENEDEDYYGQKVDIDDDGCCDLGYSEPDRNRATLDSQKANNDFCTQKLEETRLTGATAHADVNTRGLGTKNRFRQRPTRNSALDSIVIPDSDDENVPENTRECREMNAFPQTLLTQNSEEGSQ